MSVFEDPSYMATAKAQIRSYVETGIPSREWSIGRDRLIQGEPGNSYFRDWELRALCEAPRLAGPNGNYMAFLPKHFTRSAKVTSAKIQSSGGRQAFLDKYGDL